MSATVAEHHAILTRLEARWAWCATHPDHPAIREREDAVLADLRAYEQAEDEIRHAREWEAMTR